MAAEVLANKGHQVHVFDRMPSVGRKFLLAGRGGLNLTHAEPLSRFVHRYGADGAAVLSPMLDVFAGPEVCAWAAGLGVDTFVGSSGRVFPTEMKASPLLRAWLHRLRHPGVGVPVQFHERHKWIGWGEGEELQFQTPSGAVAFRSQATVLALGGGSWPRLGSDGLWVDMLGRCGVVVSPLKPSNCGFDVSGGWTPLFQQKFAGKPLKSIALQVNYSPDQLPGSPDNTVHPSVAFSRKGEFVVTQTGVEGSLVYAASRCLREQLEAHGKAVMVLDLLPDWPLDRVVAAVTAPRGSRSLSSHLKGRLALDGVKLGLLYEQLGALAMRDDPKALALALAIKALPIELARTRPLNEAISSAGGVRFDAMNEGCMLIQRPGVFCAGEMLDWDAPTGGYLLTACLSQGHWVGQAVNAYLDAKGQ